MARLDLDAYPLARVEVGADRAPEAAA